MPNSTTSQPQKPTKLPLVSTPEQWQPPGDRQDSKGFNEWIDAQLLLVPDQPMWLGGLLATLNELQIRREIERGVQLIHLDSPLPVGWTNRILSEAIERLESQGYEIPNLVLEVQS